MATAGRALVSADFDGDTHGGLVETSHLLVDDEGVQVLASVPVQSSSIQLSGVSGAPG